MHLYILWWINSHCSSPRLCLPQQSLYVQEGAPKNPRAVGEAILQNLPETGLLEGKPTLAGPGFINIKISSEWLAQQINTMLKEVDLKSILNQD